MNFFCCLSQRQNVTIDRIQIFALRPNFSDQIDIRKELSQQAVLYTEMYKNKMLLTFRKVSADGNVGDTVLVLTAEKLKISNVIEDKNVVLHFVASASFYFVLTFRDESRAKQFRSSLRDYVNPNPLSLPSGLQEAVGLGMSIFQDWTIDFLNLKQHDN